MANPPVTIGPFTNVPAPGSPIKSDWPQQITQNLVDRKVYPGSTAGGTVAASTAVDIVTLTTAVVPAGRQLLITYSAHVKQTTAAGFDVSFTIAGGNTVTHAFATGVSATGQVVTFTRKVIATVAQAYTVAIRVNAYGAQAVQYLNECNIAAQLI